MFNSQSNSFMASIMNMSADIYIQQSIQNANIGSVERSWVFYKTIECKIEPLKSKSAKAGGEGESLTLAYNERLHLKMYSLELMSKRWRIENITSNDEKPVFVEIDRSEMPNTIFNIISSHPILDPFGKVSFYVSMLSRGEAQNDNKLAT